MPKIKTNRSCRKRFKITKKGKIKRCKASRGHLRTGKSRKRKRHLRKATLVSKSDAKRIKKLLPYS